MGLACLAYLRGSKIWGCAGCHTHLAVEEDLLSTHFNGVLGQAKLFENVTNVDYSEKQIKAMISGSFTIQSIECKKCRKYLGWTYIRAHEESEGYKVGRFILEDGATCRIRDSFYPPTAA